MGVWPETVENRAALRTAIAAMLAVLISFVFHLQTPYWSGMTVVMVSNLYTGSIIDKALMLITGTLVGAFLGYFVAGLVANSFLLYLISCFLIIALSVYYFNYSDYGYAYLLGALCAFIVISQLAIDPQNAFFVAVWRPVEIGIGVLVSALSAYVIFPNHIKDNINTQVQELFDDFLDEFALLFQELSASKAQLSAMFASNLKIKRKVRKAVELMGALNQELGVSKVQVDTFRAFLDSFYHLARQLQYLTLLKPEAITLNLKPVFDAIFQDLLSLQSSFSKGTGSSILVLTEALADLEQQFQQEEKENFKKQNFMGSLIRFFKQVEQCFVLMNSLLTKTPLEIKPKYQIINRKKPLFADTDLIKESIKGGLSVLLALGFWFISSWSGGLNGIISSLIISIKSKNLFDMKKVSSHRVLGCLLGGGLALLALAWVQITLLDLMILMFFAVWGFSWFMFKFPQQAYMGLQANVALILALAQEGSSPVILDPSLQRLGGIFIGIAASFIAANVLWRTDVWTVLNRYLTKLQKYLIFNFKQVILIQGDKLSLYDLANLFWLTRTLIESLVKENVSAKNQNRLNALIVRFECLVNAQAVISHLLVSIDKLVTPEIAQILRKDLAIYEEQWLKALDENSLEAIKALNTSINNILDQSRLYLQETDPL